MTVTIPPLSVIVWKWKPVDGYRSHFGPEQVNVCASMVRRHYPHPHRFICITDEPAGIDSSIETIPLWDTFSGFIHPAGMRNPSCYRRLPIFRKEAAEMVGERFVSMDLDCVIVADMTPVWNRHEDFVIWGDTNPTTPYNGSMFLMRTGCRAKVYDEFAADPHAAIRKADQLGYFGSDQAWIGACLGPDEPRWTRRDGVYSYRNEIGNIRQELPYNARLVFFHGKWDPWHPEIMARHPWVKENWR